jgi:hypothetical protein
MEMSFTLYISNNTESIFPPLSLSPAMILQHLSKINDILEDHIDTSFDSLDSVTKIQMIIDCTKFRNSRFELNDIYFNYVHPLNPPS